eukprot:CAMPEP_0169090714 /NCGR_PEP_ID=MMETSP1015-20121227/15967_1 /TAXON_ID=342587 /ORGANISM="Karlodinium micrum, Strain CCMP2283" /LENGTH=97 /DNA_ID=CAMNT_0009151139 /DNA_START=431 /DNA_END=721 /DNA_ORIENTATION=+
MSANALMASTIGCDTTKGSLSSGGSLSAITGVVFGETSAADSVRPTSSSSSSSPSMIVLGASSTRATASAAHRPASLVTSKLFFVDTRLGDGEFDFV